MIKSRVTKIILLAFCSIILCGCDKNKPLLFFNSQPITNTTIHNPGRVFSCGQKMYYIVLVPKGFKDDYIRVQVVKKEEKTNHWGYKIYWSKDYKIDKSQKYFMSYYVPEENGYYFMQVFSFDNFDQSLIFNDFWVK